METSARLLRLLSLLQTHRDWSGAVLAERLEVTGRTLRRDVDRLRSLGYPVEARPGTGGGYRLGVGAALPPLLLDDDEAVAVAVGLRGAAMSGLGGVDETAVRALAKLEQVLPSRLRHRVADVHAAVVPMPGRGPTADVEVLLAVTSAVRDRTSLRADYRGHDGRESRRLLEPHRVVMSGRRWYLVAWDVDRAGWRTFRLDRLSPRVPAGPRFEPRPAPADDLAAYVSDGISTRAYRHRCRVTVAASATVVAGHFDPTIATVTPLDAGSCEVVTGSDDLTEVACWLGMLRAEITVHEPDALRAAMVEVSGRLARAGR
ncbi:helix-turn-helix transcriptional regulator [Jannaschia sp. R86511]|uniref:helix-turn-helix transcriptional regulator n=1 Tax=Jannaschia sp. R86511 TaxID=3093853 RepID=UPI0036D21AF9